MTSFKRAVALCFAVAVLAAMATPMMAACRTESSLPIGDIIDIGQSSVSRVNGLVFAATFAVKANTQKVSFMCNRNVSGCTPDGITYKPALSSNVASAAQTADCRTFQITATRSGDVVAGFRIRFEGGGGLGTFRRTYQLRFNTNNPSAFTLQPVANVTDTEDL